MSSTAFFQHMGMAMLLSCLAALNEYTFAGIIERDWNIALIVYVYLLYLLWQSPATVGKLTLLLVDILVVFALLYSGLHTMSLLAAYLVLIWLNRSLVYYASVLAVLTDLGLCLLSISFFGGLLLNGYGLVTAVWCLLLIQSLQSLIPVKKAAHKQETKTDDFDQALQSAENAIQQLLK